MCVKCLAQCFLRQRSRRLMSPAEKDSGTKSPSHSQACAPFACSVQVEFHGFNGAVSTIVTDTSVILCGQPRRGYSRVLEVMKSRIYWKRLWLGAFTMLGLVIIVGATTDVAGLQGRRDRRTETASFSCLTAAIAERRIDIGSSLGFDPSWS